MKIDLKQIHQKTIEIVKEIHLLDHCSWPIEVEQSFLKDFSKGNTPKISFEYKKTCPQNRWDRYGT